MRRIFSLVAVCSVATAMSLAAVPRPAAAATPPQFRFTLTVFGPAPSGDTLALFLERPPGSGQIFLFCGPLSAGGPNPAGLCEGGGKTYGLTYCCVPSGTTLFYQFQDVDPRGGLIILKEGNLTHGATINAILGTPPAPQHQCACGTGPGFGPPLPNTAVAAPVADRRDAVLPALGILMVLLGVAMSARRRRAGIARAISAG